MTSSDASKIKEILDKILEKKEEKKEEASKESSISEEKTVEPQQQAQQEQEVVEIADEVLEFIKKVAEEYKKPLQEVTVDDIKKYIMKDIVPILENLLESVVTIRQMIVSIIQELSKYYQQAQQSQQK